ncbi:hypothetical protein SKAU_G00429060 [Synaphobranchus kaupii]|uniref:Uncharacterized protein n=1 Tax=Synaphobranchus kaupii TaxID=118154 RepID=A0A9Q1E4J0_SYNKA|nr:hypothetical protein SKAU_G00429060 [Synaphobranchus kaupii]
MSPRPSAVRSAGNRRGPGRDGTLRNETVAHGCGPEPVAGVSGLRGIPVGALETAAQPRFFAGWSSPPCSCSALFIRMSAPSCSPGLSGLRGLSLSAGGGLGETAAIFVSLCEAGWEPGKHHSTPNGSNSLRGEFVHDDVWAIINNPDVRPGSSLSNIFFNDFWGKRMADNTSHKSYRPLCILTFKLNIALGGMTPLYFHVVNVCLHCAVTSLLMRTCERSVFDDSRPAFLTALLFAVHPIHTEAVSGIVGRADVLACLLFLLTFLSYIRSIDRSCSGESAPPTVSYWSLLLSLLLGTCAMLVKETGVTVFGVCVLYDGLVLCHKPLLS